MKRFFFIILFLVSFRFSFGQLWGNLSFSEVNYSEKSLKLAPKYSDFDIGVDFGYFFNQKMGITTGVTNINRYYSDGNNLIFFRDIRVPVFLRRTFVASSKIGFTQGIGYYISFPYQIETNETNTVNSGLRQGILVDFDFNVWVTDKTSFYFGIKGASDLISDNNIKFEEVGITVGMMFFIKK